MIDANHLSDAVPAALFGIFALWAAASKRHWFLRTAVVGGALLLILLIPAYEVLVQFGVGILLIIAGLGIWRRRRRGGSAADIATSPAFRLQISLQTLRW